MDLTDRRFDRPPAAGKLRLINEGNTLRALDANGRVHRLRPEFGTPVKGVTGVRQVETATAAGTVTTAGRARAELTAAGMPGSPLHIPFDVELGDELNEIAAALRAAMASHAIIDITQYFDISGEGADVVITAKEAKANDATLNLSISDGEGEGASVGVTTAATSANTTAGVARVPGTPASIGDVLCDNDFLYFAFSNITPDSTTGWKKVEYTDL